MNRLLSRLSGSAEPRTATRRSARSVARAAGVLVLAAAVIGTTAIAGSSAWFTSSATSPAVLTGATLSIGDIGDAPDPTTISVTDVYPMTDAQGTAGARSQWINIRNTGSLPLAWNLSLVNAKAVAPLTAAQLSYFRFQLLDEQGAPATTVGTFGGLPATATGTPLFRSLSELAPGATTRMKLVVWLDTRAENEYQGARATVDIVINGLQSGAPAAPAELRAVDLRATATGEPTGTSTELGWTAATSSTGPIPASDVTYRVERSTSADFRDASTVYTGSDTRYSDTSGGAAATPTDVVTTMVGYGSGSTYAIVGGSVVGWGTLVTGGTSVAPKVIPGFPADVVQLAAGQSHLCARTASDRVFCVGSDGWGQLGDGTPGGGATSSATEIATTATLSGKHIVDIAAVSNATCVLTSDGVIACWGSNDYLALGDGGLTRYRATAAVVGPPGAKMSDLWSGRTITGLVGGPMDFCAITTDGLYCWGDTSFNQLTATGRADYLPMQSMNVPQLFPAGRVLDAAVGWGSICAVTTSHAAVCAGHDNHGALGDGYSESTGRIGRQLSVAVSDVDHIVAGQSHACAWSATKLSCWGWGANGQVGNGSALADNTRAVAVDARLGGAAITTMSAGYDSTCALADSGSLLCWGNNAGGRLLAQSTSTGNIVTPTAVTALGALACPIGATSANGTCSLQPTGSYYYRVTYTVAGSATVSPAAVASRT